jgi:hypothetical protein
MAVKTTAKPVPKIMSPGANPSVSPAALELKKIRDFYAKNGHVPTILANESKKMFGSANATDVSNLGKQVALGKMTQAEALKAVRAGTAGVGDLNKRAGLATSLEIDPAEQAVRDNLAAIDAAFQSSSTKSQQLGQATVARQKAIYDALQRTIADEAPNIQGQYAATGQQVAGNYDAAAVATKQNFDAAAANSNNQANRMGLVPSAVANDDSNFLQGILASQKTAAQGTLANLQQADINSANQFSRSVGAESAGVQTGTIGDFAARQQAALDELTKQKNAGTSQINNLESTRGAKLYETLQGLQAARQQQLVDAQDRQFQQMIAQQTLGVKQTEAQTHQFSAQTDRAKVQQAAKLSDAQLQKIQRESVPGTLEYETAVAAIELKKAQAAAAVTNAKTGIQNANTAATKVNNAANATTKYGKGMPGVANYLKDMNVDQATYDMAMKHVNNTIASHKTGDYANGLRGVEGYIKAHKLPPNIANVLRTATAIAYGKN